MQKITTITQPFQEILAICYFWALWACPSLPDHIQQKQKLYDQAAASNYMQKMNFRHPIIFETYNLHFFITWEPWRHVVFTKSWRQQWCLMLIFRFLGALSPKRKFPKKKTAWLAGWLTVVISQDHFSPKGGCPKNIAKNP